MVDEKTIHVRITGGWAEESMAAQLVLHATPSYRRKILMIRSREIDDLAAWDRERGNVMAAPGRILRIEAYRPDDGASEQQAKARMERRQADMRGLVAVDVDIIGPAGAGKSVLARLLADVAVTAGCAVSLVDNGTPLEPGQWPELPKLKANDMERNLRIVAGREKTPVSMLEMKEYLPRIRRARTGAPVMVPAGSDWIVTHIFAVPDPGTASGEVVIVADDGREVFSAPTARLMEDYASMKTMDGHAGLPTGRHLFEMVEERALAMDPGAFALIAEELKRATRAWSAFHSAVVRPIDPYGFVGRTSFTFERGRRMPDGKLDVIRDGSPVEIEIWMMEIRRYVPPKDETKAPGPAAE